MQKFVNQAIGSMLVLCAAFAHADVVPTAVQTSIAAAPLAELSTQSRRGSLNYTSTSSATTARASANPDAGTAGDNTSTGWMVLGALAIMGVMARRRWNTRA